MAVKAKLRYSALVLDLDITACFFELQDTRLPPRKIQKPKVDVLSSGSQAQLASQKAKKFKLGLALRVRPKEMVPFK